MSLLLRINLALASVFAAAALLGGYLCWNILEANARREVFAQAGLMMDSALSIRSYTAGEIVPLLTEGMRTDFLPQSIPSYAATQNFQRLREHRPDYAYKEATLNPTNPRDRATDWESDLVQRFRNDTRAHEIIGERDSPLGRTLYLARPIRSTHDCALCHSLPAVAPATLIARYGSNNGFGWADNEIVGAQIVSVPFANATTDARRAFHGVVATFVAIFVAVFLVVNAALYTFIVRPVRAIASSADRLSLGDHAVPPFPQGGALEIRSLVQSFNRMRKSLEKALRMLEP